MKLKLVLFSTKDYISLPIHYNQTIQGMLYKSLPKFLSDFLHNSGFSYNKRPFRLSILSNKTLPPITVYRTVEKNGKEYKDYIFPKRKKFKILNNFKPDIEPEGKTGQVILIYKDFL